MCLFVFCIFACVFIDFTLIEFGWMKIWFFMIWMNVVLHIVKNTYVIKYKHTNNCCIDNVVYIHMDIISPSNKWVKSPIKLLYLVRSKIFKCIFCFVIFWEIKTASFFYNSTEMCESVDCALYATSSLNFFSLGFSFQFSLVSFNTII